MVECIEITKGSPVDAAVIWMHGLGADGNDFVPIVPELRLPEQPGIRFLFPHAPERPVTINGGMSMRAWYDIDPAAGPASADADIAASAEAVQALIEGQTAAGIEPGRIVLAGFSQGGVMALHCGLRAEARLAGIMALSTYLHDAERVTDAITLAAAETPVFMAHGVMDPMIPIARGITARERLLELGFPVEWHEYPMGHAVCPQEIGDIAAWLRRVLPARAGTG